MKNEYGSVLFYVFAFSVCAGIFLMLVNGCTPRYDVNPSLIDLLIETIKSVFATIF